jgi:hypothetical protein
MSARNFHAKLLQIYLMENAMKYALILLIAALAGCGTVPSSSGVLPLGPDTYRISARASMGAEAQSQKMAVLEGQQYCKTVGREFMVIGTKVLKASGGYEVTFRCLKANDPELVRPNLEKAPDTVIQIR